MTMNLVWVLSLLLAALAMVPAAAHLLELPNKIRLTGKEYLTVQRLYLETMESVLPGVEKVIACTGLNAGRTRSGTNKLRPP